MVLNMTNHNRMRTSIARIAAVSTLASYYVPRSFEATFTSSNRLPVPTFRFRAPTYEMDIRAHHKLQRIKSQVHFTSVTFL